VTAAQQLEEGFVAENPYLHAARRNLDGLCAACGAGIIVQVVPGRFDPDDQRACPSCSQIGTSIDLVNRRGTVALPVDPASLDTRLP
jgi:hypothetical protein